MSSKVMVNLPSDPFQQIRKKHENIVKTDRSSSSSIPGPTSTDPVIRANQLEQNIRFLQEQHQIMLAGLHKEIEILRQKNRDLQFQIVFSRGVNLVKGSPSSDEEYQKNFSFSPGQVNVTPLQIEILERNIAELRTNLSEAKTRNIYLQNIIDEQSKKIEAMENEKYNELAAVGKKFGKENVVKAKSTVSQSEREDFQEKLEDADRLIRRLKRENEEQRKEIISLITSMNKGKTDSRRRDGNNGHKGYSRNNQGQGSRFPPLHNYPPRRQRSNSNYSFEGQSGQTIDREKETETVRRPSLSLPYLRDRNNASTSSGYGNSTYNSHQTGNHRRGFHNYRNHDEHRENGRPNGREQNHSHLHCSR